MFVREEFITAQAVDFRELIHCRASRGILPRRVEVQLIRAVSIARNAFEAGEIHDYPCIGGIVVAHSEALHRRFIVSARRGKITALSHDLTHSMVGTHIGGIAAKGFHEVILRLVGVVLVLHQVCAVYVQLLNGGNVGGARRDRTRFRRLPAALLRLIGDEYLSAGGKFDPQIGEYGRIHHHAAGYGRVRRDIRDGFKDEITALIQAEYRVRMSRGGNTAESHEISVNLQRNGAINGGVLHLAYAPHGEPDLREFLRLAWHDVGEVGLVVCIYTGHQLYVAVAVVGKVCAPRVAERAVAPRPHLLADAVVMVGDCDGARIRRKVVAGEKVHI